MEISKVLGIGDLAFNQVKVKEVVLEAGEGPYSKPVEIIIRFSEPKPVISAELKKLEKL